MNKTYYITGDIHGDIYPIINLIDKYELTKKDTIIILGDVGLNFYENERDSKKKKRLNKTGVQFLCIHGNHEIRPSNIKTYQEQKWRDGIVYEEKTYKNIHFAKDGEVYDLDGVKALCIGGAYSVDKKRRIAANKYWWPDEQPSNEIKKIVIDKLNSLNWEVDIVFSHTCPKKYIPIEAFISGVNQDEVDQSTEEWLEYIESKLKYNNWYCGHWHINKKIDKLYFLFNGIIELKTKHLEKQ